MDLEGGTDAHNCRMRSSLSPKFHYWLTREMLVSLDRAGGPNELFICHNIDEAVFVRTLSAQSVKVLCPRGAPYCPAHQRHALDRNTFRQSTRGLTISRGASSPIYPFRHPWFTRPSRYHRALRPDSRAATSTSRRQLRLLHHTH